MHDEQRRRRTGTGGGFVLGLLCGAAAGTAAGLLLARRPGTELRRQMADSASRLKRRASSAYGQASEGLDRMVERSRHAWEVGREAFRTARPATRPTPIPVNGGTPNA
jgi:gas vesicle protein